MDKSVGRCIAFREGSVNDSIIYVPCRAPIKFRNAMKKKTSRRFCPYHEKAFREILLGILNARKA